MNSHQLKKYELKPGDSGQLLYTLKELLYSLPDVQQAVPHIKRSERRPYRTLTYDDATQAAVKHFQKSQRLKVADGTMTPETWAALGRRVGKRAIDAYTLHDPVLGMLLRGGKKRWPSKFDWRVHQESVRRVLSNSLSPQDLKRVQEAAKDADRSEWQTVEYSHRHAMTPKGMSQDEARRLANQFVRDELTLAQRLEARGDRAGAMLHLGYGMHCLQDSTSPAHAGFRVYEGGNVELLSHIYEELFDPKEGSRLDEATKRSYLYFKGTLRMPADFFADLGHDVYKEN